MTAHTDAAEEGRKVGLGQAVSYLQGEVAKLRAQQHRDGFDRQRDLMITKLLAAARQIEKLK